jgi:hypothetical protein
LVDDAGGETGTFVDKVEGIFGDGISVLVGMKNKSIGASVNDTGGNTGTSVENVGGEIGDGAC